MTASGQQRQSGGVCWTSALPLIAVVPASGEQFSEVPDADQMVGLAGAFQWGHSGSTDPDETRQ
jgi:hypothetical protein